MTRVLAWVAAVFATCLALVISPAAIAAASMVAGVALAVAGVHMLFGLGWALIAGSVPLMALSAVLIRGLLRVA